LICVLLLLLMSTLLTGSRAGILELTGMIGIFLVQAIGRRRGKNIVLVGFFILAGTSALMVLVSYFPQVAERGLDGIISTLNNADASNLQEADFRIELIRNSLIIFYDHPFIGVGLG